jgi:hypothetical protein
VLDLLRGIDRRVSHLERALPSHRTKKRNKELAAQLDYLLPILAWRSAQQSNENVAEVVCYSVALR